MNMIVGVTGHRPDRLGVGYSSTHPKVGWLKDRLRVELIRLSATGTISGFALGVDTYFTEVALELKIPVVAAIPFDGQELRWPTESQKRYHELLSKTQSKTVVAPGGYASWKLSARNNWIVDHCDHLIAVFDGSACGGTWNTLQFAQRVGRQITLINPTDFVIQ